MSTDLTRRALRAALLCLAASAALSATRGARADAEIDTALPPESRTVDYCEPAEEEGGCPDMATITASEHSALEERIEAAVEYGACEEITGFAYPVRRGGECCYEVSVVDWCSGGDDGDRGDTGEARGAGGCR